MLAFQPRHDHDPKAVNYVNLSRMMDIIFGTYTYTCPGHEPEALGIDEPTAKTYVGHMIQPFCPDALAESITPTDSQRSLL